MIGFTTFAVAFALRGRLRSQPMAMVWLVLGLLAAGRFVEFFVRSDSAKAALGLEVAQWTSLVLISVALVGAWVTRAGRLN
jgi:prolipoprotein diacylglyceryltransferase